MMNLYYRGYVIHEEIRSICYTVFGSRPNRIELGSSGTALEAMRRVDRHLAQREVPRWVHRDAARRNGNGNGKGTGNGQARTSQFALR